MKYEDGKNPKLHPEFFQVHGRDFHRRRELAEAQTTTSQTTFNNIIMELITHEHR